MSKIITIKKMIHHLLWVGVLMLVMPISMHAQTYVSTSGNDTNTGTQASPYKTIQKAVNMTAASGLVYVSAGIYNENVNVNKNLSLIGDGSATTIINGQGNSDLGSVTLTQGRDGVTIQGFTIKGIDNSNGLLESAAIYLQGSQLNITIRNNIIEARGDAGLMGEYNAVNENIIIDNNVFTGQTFSGSNPATSGANVARQGVLFGGSTSTTNTKNFTFTNNTIETNSAGTSRGNTLVTLDLVGINTISGNSFRGKASGTTLRLRGTGTYLVNNNSFEGTYVFGFTRAIERTGSSIDATCNWWGQDTGAKNSQKSGMMVTSTWRINNDLSTPNCAGGQPVQLFRGGVLIDGFSKIQLAVDAAVAGDVIKAAKGSYTENININKSVTILGANSGKNPNTVSRLAESRLFNSTIELTGSGTIDIDGFEIYQNNDVMDVVLIGGSTITTLQNNIIKREGVNVGTNVRAVTTSAGPGQKTITNNLFTGDTSGGLYSGHKTWNSGMYVNGGSSTVAINNNVFKNCRAALNIDDMNSDITLNGNSFSGSGTLISFGGTSPTAGSFTFGPNDYIPSGGTFMNLSNVDSSFRLDISAGTTGGTAFSSLSLANLFLVESTMYHRTRSSRNGLVYYVANTQYVLAATNNNIQTAIDYAASGDVVTIQDGSYNQRLTVGKSITLDGQSESGTILNGAGLDGTGSGITINSGVTNVTIQDLTVQNFAGNGPNSFAGIYAIGGNNTLTVQNTTIKDNLGGSGIYANGPIDNVLLNNLDISGHTAVQGAARGIVIWNGLKSNITITNSDIYNNNCCGIELQDGSATGVNISNNNVTNNGDNGLGLTGLMGPGENVVSNNVVKNNGRFGIEIKNPNGSGTESGAASIVVENNTVSISSITDARDIAGIAVFRRGVIASNNNVDVPNGVIVQNNAVSGYTQSSTSEGFGIVIEGTNHTVTGNNVISNDIGIQQQAGYTPYPDDGDQTNKVDTYFGRGNSPSTCGNTVSGNTLSNTLDERNVGVGSGLVTNATTSVIYCSIQSAINAAAVGNVIEVSSGTYNEQVLVNKAVTIKGVGVTKPIIDFTGTPGLAGGGLTAFKVTSADVTVENFEFKVDISKLGSAILATGATLNLTVKDNDINPYRSSTTTTSYGLINAISINYGDFRVNAANPTFTIEGNTISYNNGADSTPGNTDDAGFRSGLSADEAGGTFANNTVQTINHDAIIRFTSAGAINVSNNNLNGGGLEFVDFNAGAGTLTVNDNIFNGAFSNTYSNALRLKNNTNAITTIVSGNTFTGFVGNVTGYGATLSMENYQAISIDNNTFTPLTNSTTYRHISVNTKDFSSSSGYFAPVVDANITKNTFNGSGTAGGIAIGFYNWDNDNPTFNTFTIGTAGNENTFASDIATYMHLDNSTGTIDPKATTRAPWTTDLNIANNQFASALPANMTKAQLFALEDKVVHSLDVIGLGLVTWVDNNNYVTTNTLGIQRGVNAASAGFTVNVDAGSYPEQVTINKVLTILGPNASVSPNTGTRVAEAILVNEANGRAFSISNGNTDVSISGFKFDGGSPIHDGNGSGFPNTSDVTFSNNFVVNANAIYSGANSSWADLLIKDNKFENINATSTASAMQVSHTTSTTVTDNTFINVNYAAMVIDATPVISIANNTINGTGAQGIQLAGAIGNATIEKNKIANANTGQEVDKGAIRLYGADFTGAVLISNNEITGGFNGIAVKNGQNITGKNIIITENSITGLTSGNAIYHGGTGTLNATCNWFGTATQADVASAISGNVTYLPYLSGGTDDGDAKNGFQPQDACIGGLTVSVFSDDAETTLVQKYQTIQGAIDAASTLSGYVVRAEAGTYTESLNINKSITLRGAQQGIDPRPSVSSSRVIGSIGETKLVSARNQKAIVISTNDVTIDGFEITQIGGTGAATTIETTNANHSGVSIINNIVTNTTTSNAMRLIGGQDFLIQNNYLKDIPGEGIVIRNGNAFLPVPTNQKIKDNDIINQYGVSGGAIVTYGQTGMEISGNIIKAKYQGIAIGADGPAYYFVQDIEVHHNEIVMEMATTSVQDYGVVINGLGDNINIHNNIISDLSSNTGSKYALIKVSFDDLSSAVSNPQNLVINDNYLSRSVNENYITVGANITNEVNATCNWYETSDSLEIAARIGGTGSISYLPFLNNGTDDNVSDIGFTPVSGACVGCPSGNLVTNTNTNVNYCSIQPAIDAAAAGDVITVSPGIYTENVTVNKSLTIRGANTGKNPNTVSRTAESRLLDGTITISGANTVVLDGFEVYQTNNGTAISIAGESGVTLENTILNRQGAVVGNAGIAVQILAGTGVKSISANKFTGSYNSVLASSSTWLLTIDLKGNDGNTVTIVNNLLEKSYKAINIDDMSAGIDLIGNKFTSGNTWMSFGGSSPTVGSFTFGANDFGFSGGDFIDLINVDPSFRLDISAGSYNNQSFSSISLYNSFVIESKIKHRLRNDRNGLVYLVPNTQYVSYNSIQDAIDYAPSFGETINIRAGNYITEQLLINKSLTLKGPNYNIPCGASRLPSTEANIISYSSATPITVTADDVTINGLGIKGTKAFNAINVGSFSNTTIAFNNIREIGTDNSASGSNVHAILYTLGTANTTDVAIVNNCIDNVGRTSLSSYSASAIGIIQTSSTGVLDGLSIENNIISNVKVNTAPWPAGKVAYGILTNVGGNSSFASNTGNVKNANISFNTISGLSGHIATGIALEGNTEDAVVERNTVSNLTSTKTANRAGGGFDLNGLKFENNKYLSTITVQNNSFDVGASGYAVANYVPTATGGVASLNCNWFGSSDYGALEMNYNAATPVGKIFNKEGAGTMFIPYLSNAIIDPTAVGYTCSSSFAVPTTLDVTYTAAADNIVVNFELSNNTVAAYPIPGLNPAMPADLNVIGAKYAALKVAMTGTPEQLKAAAFALGDDIITEYYYMNGTDEVYLQTAGNNDLIKSKYWDQYLVNSGTTVRYPNFGSNLFIVPQGSYATSTNPLTGLVPNGWLVPAYGKDLYVRVTVINNGNVSVATRTVSIDAVPLSPVYSGSTIISSLAAGTAIASKSDAYLNIVSNNLGVVITRVNGAASIVNPVEGMIIYDISDNTFKVNTTGTVSGWRPFAN